MPFIAIALIIAAALGGGAATAAQGSLPGDALWGFKVNVNERVETALSFSEEAKANADLRAIEARLKEAAELNAKGRLSADVRAQIEDNFDARVESVESHIERLQAQGDFAAAADVAARFQATIARHAAVLAEAEANVSANASATAKAVLGSLVERVRATLDVASDISAEASAEAATHPSTSTGSDNNTNATGSVNADINADANVRGGAGNSGAGAGASGSAGAGVEIDL